MSWIDNLEVNFEHNDIISSTAEAVVCPVTVNLAPYGKISQQFFELDGVGEALIAYKQTIKSNLTLGEVASLKNQPEYEVNRFERLIFVAMWDDESEYGYALFYKAYVNALREAFKHNLKTIALPIMAYDGNLDFSTNAVAQVVKDLNELKSSDQYSIEELCFISNNLRHVECLDKKIAASIYK